MTQGDVEVVRRLFESANERDWAACMDCYADDVVLRVHLRGLAPVLGKAAVGEWFADWFSSFDRDYHFDIEEVRDLGGRQVLMVATHNARSRIAATPVHQRAAWLYVLRDGAIVRCDVYGDPETALEAAGLDP